MKMRVFGIVVVRGVAAVAFAAIFVAPASPGSLRASEDGGPGSDKAGYTLFNPTPRAQMREMSTDRPDVTESPKTVDAGHVQVELSFGDYVRDEEDGVKSETSTVLPFNVKLGLTNNIDVQLVVEPYVHQRIRSDAARETDDGFGSTQLRLKVNLWGNDEGATALAIMPF